MSTESLPFAAIAVEPGLTLQQLQESQADEMFAVVDQNRDYLAEWLPWANDTRSSEDTLAFIRKMIEKRKSGEEYGYGINVDGALVGHISLMHLNDDKPPEIGYWLSKEVAGKGIMTKAVKVLANFAVNELELKRIVLRARPDNIASNKVAEKSGFTFMALTTDDKGEHNLWELRG